MLSPALTQWIESELGGAVARSERIGSGASRATFLVVLQPGARLRECVLRLDTHDGPMAGTPLDLAREAAVYRALSGTAVRIPKLLGVLPEEDALLLERAEGSPDLASAPDPATRDEIVLDYARALAVLHTLDCEQLDLPGFARPADGPEHALCDLRTWRDIHDGHAGPPLEWLAFALDWLAAHPPAHAERTSLCHGDAGAGNFLFADRRVTALLDWEFAHLGDPTDDLAWVAVRAHLLGVMGPLEPVLRGWSQASGLALDGGRLEYYRALVLARMATSCRVALHKAEGRDAGAMDLAVYRMLLPYLQLLLPQALAWAGCRDPKLDVLRKSGEAAVETHPVLRAHAKPLAPLTDL